MSISNTPTFNLKAVIKETGIAADTLRAWERRYGLPMPDRTPGGHRLYSQRDIEIVKWLMEKQGEGLSISRAVDLWNDLTASGEDPLPAPVSQVVTFSSANLDAIRKAWLDACLVYDESTAELVLNQAFATHPLETVCIEVMQRGLQEVGEMWYHNQINAQQEHFTSALVQRRLDALISAAPPPTRPYSILIGSTSGEQHVFVPLLLTLLLRRRGLKVVYLGANVPIQRFNETLQSIKPHLVILSAQLLQTANSLRDTAAYLKVNGGRVAYGGRIFTQLPELRKRIPAHYLGNSIQEAIQAVEALLTSDIPLEGITPVDEKDKKLSISFTHNQPMIDMYTLTETTKTGIPIEFSTIAIQHLGKNLESALSFGNLEALEVEMTWIEGLVREHNQRVESLDIFFSAYAKSIDSAMGKDGRPISDWIRSQINGKQSSN
jgi:DNA-binding transcriptional MerR regulator